MHSGGKCAKIKHHAEKWVNMTVRIYILACAMAAAAVACALICSSPWPLLALLPAVGLVVIRLAHKRRMSAPCNVPAEPEPEPEVCKKRVVIVGTGLLAVRLLSHVTARCEDWEVVGFADESGTRSRNTVNGVRVLGCVSELVLLAKEVQADVICIAVRQEGETLELTRRICLSCAREVYELPAAAAAAAGPCELVKLSNPLEEPVS